MELFLAFLAQHDDGAWLRAIDRLQPAMHAVDRTATRIWFHFFPLALQHAMTRPDAAVLARRMALAGRWRLAEQIDSSHAFLYAHQYWPVVKRGVLAYVDGRGVPGSLDLAAQINEIARHVALEAAVDPSIVTGLCAIGLRTLQQVGPALFAAAAAATVAPGVWAGKTADQVLAARERQDGQGPLGFLRGSRKLWTVVFDERVPSARFPLIDSQQITTAAALDRRDYRDQDPRCSQGPIPVHCQACSCGTCWVGVLGGADKLSRLDDRERAKLAECGYSESDESHPPIRLACMAQAFGRVSLVIPPWNGQVARVLETLR